MTTLLKVVNVINALFAEIIWRGCSCRGMNDVCRFTIISSQPHHSFYKLSGQEFTRLAAYWPLRIIIVIGLVVWTLNTLNES